MKVSEITTELTANYLRIDYEAMTTTEKTELSMLIDTAKTFIRSYTGIKDQTITGEKIGIGDGETIAFKTAFPVIPETSTIYLDGEELTETTDYVLNDTTGDILFIVAPADNVEITADYQTGLDAYNDFVIAVYALVQNMYDSRSYYVEKTNVNKVVEIILGMHSLNLL